jgi:hypothetical protein
MGRRLYGVKGEPMTSRLRVFREEELSVDDDFGEEPTSPSRRIRIGAAVIDPLEQTAVPPATGRVRPAKVTEPLPLPRPPRG